MVARPEGSSSRTGSQRVNAPTATFLRSEYASRSCVDLRIGLVEVHVPDRQLLRNLSQQGRSHAGSVGILCPGFRAWIQERGELVRRLLEEQGLVALVSCNRRRTRWLLAPCEASESQLARLRIINQNLSGVSSAVVLSEVDATRDCPFERIRNACPIDP